MLNKAMLIGRLGKDPELNYSTSGTPYGKFSIATDESYVDRDGNKVDKTEWHQIVVYQRQAENCAKYLAKGSLVFIEGKIQTRKWQDQQGQDRYTTEIVAQRVQFLDSKNAQNGQDQDRNQNQPQNRNTQPRNGNNQPRNGRNQQANGNVYNEQDYEPSFPSEASGMDDVPF